MTALLWLALLVAAVPALGHLALAAAGRGRGLGTPRRAGRLPSRMHRLRRSAPPVLDRLALDAATGLVLLFALLLLLDLASLPWRRGVLAAAVAMTAAALSALAWRRRPAAADPAPPAPPLGWADGVSALVVALFATAAWTRRVNIPDFVYHWGLKGKRYWLHGGIDLPFFTDPLGLTDHPDYPNLLPALYAVTAEALGRFRERAMLGWSVLFVVLIVLAARRALATGLERRWGGGGLLRNGSLVRGGALAVALVAVLFAVGYQLAGGGDLLIALALLLALPGLLHGPPAEPGRVAAADLRVGVAAALAAGAKIEGVPLALLLVAARWWAVAAEPRWGPPGRWATWRRQAAALLRRLPRLAGPPALVVVPWSVQCASHGLFRQTNTGSFRAERWSEVGPALWQVLNMPDWYRLPWLLALLPPLLLVRRVRPAVLVLCAQAAFYLFVYLTAPVDTGFYVLSSLPRLLYHLVVPALVVLVVGTAAASRDRPPTRT